MPRSVWLLAALVFAAPARAQTCAGVLRLTFTDPTTSARPQPLVAIREIDVRAQFFDDPVRAGTQPSATALPGALRTDNRVALPAYGRAYVAGTTLSLVPRCGTTLLHLTLVYHHQTMVLDLYRVPNHIGVAFDAPVSFRSGRHVLDFDTARRVSHGVFSAADVRPAGR